MIRLVFILQIFFITSFAAISSEVFPDIEGLQKDGKVEVYDSNDLYDYINGAADSYLNYDFVSLTLQRYKGKNDQSLKIEIYEHSNVYNGFGIYSSERPSKGNWVEVGDQGYFEKDIFNFYKGQYYVKIMTYDIENSKDMLVNTASSVSEKLDCDKEILTVFELFPSERKKENSEKYIHKNFMGYETLSGVFTAEYEIEGNYFELFYIEKENDKICGEMLEEYFRSIKLDSIKFNEGKLLVKDPYQGDFNIIWNKNILIGAINYSDAKLAEKYLELMNTTIKSHLP